MKETEGLKKMKKTILMGLVIAACVTLVLSVGGFTAYAIARNVKQQKNEKTIRGTWYKDGEEVISFTSWGIAHINEKFIKDDIGLFEGVAAYYLSDPKIINRISLDRPLYLVYKPGKEVFVLFVKNVYKSMSPNASFKRYIDVRIIFKAEKLGGLQKCERTSF